MKERMPQFSGNDRRQVARMPYRTSLAYALQNRSGSGSVRDISSSGLFLEASETFAVGDLLSMQFRFRHSRADMPISGEIRHVAPNGVGIRLIWEDVTGVVVRPWIKRGAAMLYCGPRRR